MKNLINNARNKLGKPVVHTQRILRSDDGGGIFQGTLVSCDSKSGLLEVRKTRGQTVIFKVDLLSDEDQDYFRGRQRFLLPLVIVITASS